MNSLFSFSWRILSDLFCLRWSRFMNHRFLSLLWNSAQILDLVCFECFYLFLGVKRWELKKERSDGVCVLFPGCQNLWKGGDKKKQGNKRRWNMTCHIRLFCLFVCFYLLVDDMDAKGGVYRNLSLESKKARVGNFGFEFPSLVRRWQNVYWEWETRSILVSFKGGEA